MKNAIALAAAAALLCIAGLYALSAEARATDTEADAIVAVYTAWADEPDATANAPFLADLAALYPTASPACQRFIAVVFVTLAIWDASQSYSPDGLALDWVAGMALTFERNEYACRIAT